MEYADHRAAIRSADFAGTLHEYKGRGAAGRAQLEWRWLYAQRDRARSAQRRLIHEKRRKSMAISANAIARGAIAAAGLILLPIATPARSVAQPAPVAESPPLAPASSMVTGGGVTLHSVNVKFPRSDSTFSGGRGADAINNDCLLCHSAGMVLDQAKLSRAEWQTEVDKMRDSFKAPFAAEDIPAIVDYLV